MNINGQLNNRTYHVLDPSGRHAFPLIGEDRGTQYSAQETIYRKRCEIASFRGNEFSLIFQNDYPA